MRRPQFTLRALLVLLLAVACFFGGIRFERERRRREEKAARAVFVPARLKMATPKRGKIEETFDKFDDPQEPERQLESPSLAEPR